MAKGLPYFKFTPTEWLTGNICYEPLEVQGLFINICALYWQRDGKLSIEDINLRYNKPTALVSLTDRYFSVSDGFICIGFLNEQLHERRHISVVNSDNGKLGGRPKTKGTKPTANRSESEKKPIRKRKKKEEEENNIPAWDDFFEYTKTLPIYKTGLDYSIRAKYNSWVSDGWKDGNGNKIINWKTKIQNTLPHLKEVRNETPQPQVLNPYSKNLMAK